MFYLSPGVKQHVASLKDIKDMRGYLIRAKLPRQEGTAEICGFGFQQNNKLLLIFCTAFLLMDVLVAAQSQLGVSSKEKCQTNKVC